MGHIPILLGDLNINLVSPRNKQDEMIAEQVQDVMGLIDVSCQFKQHCQAKARSQWTWRMRRGGDGSPPSVTTSSGERSTKEDFAVWHCRCLVTTTQIIVQLLPKIYSGAEKKSKAYQRRFSKYLIGLPQGPQGELETLFEELHLDVAPPPPRGKDPKINEYLIAHGCSSINRWHCGELGNSTSAEPASSEDASKLL
jgi:hypothetical protein